MWFCWDGLEDHLTPLTNREAQREHYGPGSSIQTHDYQEEQHSMPPLAMVPTQQAHSSVQHSSKDAMKS